MFDRKTYKHDENVQIRQTRTIISTQIHYYKLYRMTPIFSYNIIINHFQVEKEQYDAVLNIVDQGAGKFGSIGTNKHLFQQHYYGEIHFDIETSFDKSIYMYAQIIFPI